MSIKGVIFDFDGTLADPLADLTDAVNVGLSQFGYPHRSTEQIRSWIGIGLPTLCRLAIGNGIEPSPGSPEEALCTQMAAAVTAHYQQHRMDKTAAYPGIPEVLDALKDGNIQMAVLSNKPHQHTAPMIEEMFGRWQWIAIEGCRDNGQRKPDPEIALNITSQMSLEPQQVMMVGDSAVDVQTGLNAGMVAVGVTWGFRDRDDLAGAHHIIDRPTELLPLIF